jgi:hypothetical protein
VKKVSLICRHLQQFTKIISPSNRPLPAPQGAVNEIVMFPFTSRGSLCEPGFMARKLRIQYPGAMYHVMNRGDRREAIFEDDEGWQRLLETLSEACGKTGW